MESTLTAVAAAAPSLAFFLIMVVRRSLAKVGALLRDLPEGTRVSARFPGLEVVLIVPSIQERAERPGGSS